MALLRINDKRRSQEEKIEILLQAATGNYCALLGKVIIIAPREQKLTDITCDLGPVVYRVINSFAILLDICGFYFPSILHFVYIIIVKKTKRGKTSSSKAVGPKPKRQRRATNHQQKERRKHQYR